MSRARPARRLSLFPALAADSTTTRVHGSVVKADGTPVAGALVVARPKELPKPPEAEVTGDATATPVRLPETKTGADGRFSLEVAGTPPVTLRVEAAGFATAVRKDLAGDQPVTVTLEAGLALSGQVFDRKTGRPLAKAEVEAAANDALGFFDPDDAKRFRAKATADAQGRFRFASLSPDYYTVYASAPGFRTASRDRIGVGLGAAPADLFLYLKPGIAIPGRVAGKDGKPIAKARVSVRPSGGFPSNLADWTGGGEFVATTDDKGAFEVTGVPLRAGLPARGDARRLRAGVARRRARQRRPARAAVDDHARSRRGAGGQAAGRRPAVRRPDRRRRDLRVARRLGGHGRAVRRSGPKVVAKEGAFRIERLPTGTATVEVEPNGYAPVEEGEGRPGGRARRGRRHADGRARGRDRRDRRRRGRQAGRRGQGRDAEPEHDRRLRAPRVHDRRRGDLRARRACRPTGPTRSPPAHRDFASASQKDLEDRRRRRDADAARQGLGNGDRARGRGRSAGAGRRALRRGGPQGGREPDGDADRARDGRREACDARPRRPLHARERHPRHLHLQDHAPTASCRRGSRRRSWSRASRSTWGRSGSTRGPPCRGWSSTRGARRPSAARRS